MPALPGIVPGGDVAGQLAPIDRAFVRLREGLLHYRCAGFVHGAPRHRGAPLPLYLVHAGPGSSRGLGGRVQRLGTDRAVIAPDTLGAGDSAAPDVPKPAVPYYAESVVRSLDALGIERIDYYGSHTGAHIGCELALRWPQRVQRLVFDGLPLLRLPVLCIGREGDPLASYVERAVALIPGAVPRRVARADGAGGRDPCLPRRVTRAPPQSCANAPCANARRRPRAGPVRQAG